MIVYPVKSCKGVNVPSSELNTRGFQFDRQWMVVDSDGDFVTQWCGKSTPDYVVTPKCARCSSETTVLYKGSPGLMLHRRRFCALLGNCPCAV